MGGSLRQAQRDQYRTEGYVPAIPVLEPEEVSQLRADLERWEAHLGHPLDFPEKSKSYLLYEWADRIAHHPRVLDAVESVLGPDILLYHSTTWIKEAGTPAFVHWHQDGTYFFLEPALHVTAWVALSDSIEESGCVEVLPATHELGQLDHRDDPGPWNMIKRGQGLAQSVDESAAVALSLRAGQMSLHHTNLIHRSQGNRGTDRRIGLGLSYIPAEVRQVGPAHARASALLVRGEDRYQHFVPERRLKTEMSAQAQRAHAEAVERFRARQDAGMDIQVMEAARQRG